MSLLFSLIELSISSRMYPHFRRFDSLGWHFTVKVPPQEIVLGQRVFLWDQSCSLMIQVRYFSGLAIVNLVFLLYCASDDIYCCNTLCMWRYWALWNMGTYFWVHLLYYGYWYYTVLIGRGKKVKLRVIFRDKFAEKAANFGGILRAISGQSLPKSNR